MRVDVILTCAVACDWGLLFHPFSNASRPQSGPHLFYVGASGNAGVPPLEDAVSRARVRRRSPPRRL